MHYVNIYLCWCNTHEPHATIPSGKKGYVIALRTGPNMPECEKIIATQYVNLNSFYYKTYYS